MSKTFSLFYVSEYKGGELHSLINLSEYDLCNSIYGDHLCDYFYDNEKDKTLKLDYKISEILEIFDEIYDESWDHIYAGGSTGGYECYQHIENKLFKVNMLDECSDEIKIELFNNLLKEFLSK